MIQKVLAAIDLSDNHEGIFEQAVAIATASGAELMLLHVLSYEEPNSPAPILTPPPYAVAAATAERWNLYQQEWEQYEKKGLDLLRTLGDKATAAGVQTEFTQNYGSTGRIICEMAQNIAADVIVIGRRSHSGLGELLLGSVSNYVVHHAPCSIFIVKLP